MQWSLPAFWSAVERFAHARGAIPATFLWNLAQGAVVPGPSELLMLPLAIADPPRTRVLACTAAVASVTGGCIAYALGAAAFATVGKPLLDAIGIGDATLARIMALMLQHGWLFVIGSALTPVSAKALAMTAGAVAMPFPVFALALTAGRVLRYSIIVLLLEASAGTLFRLRTQLLKR